MSAPEIITFGCRLNAFESEVMRGLARQAGLADAVIVNTCAVTAEAERQARQAIRRARRAHPDARIIVTGCAAQIDPARYAAMPEVDRVLGNEDKLVPGNFAPEAAEPVVVNDIMAVRETAPHLLDGPAIAGFEGRARAFVQVQTGCDHRCTFCIIPQGRGNGRSVPLGAIVDQLRALVAHGCKEVVLSGVDIASYGADLPGRPGLADMVRRLLIQVPELPRLRLSSLDPAAMDADFVALFAGEPRLMPHIHLSLQAGDDMVLKRMKRRHDRAGAVALCARLRAARPEVVFGADLIAGFPTETDAMFANSLALIADCGLTHLHVFPYSPRAGTPAARMPQVAPAVRKARAARLRAAGAAALARFLESQRGRDCTALVERPHTGRSEHYAVVALDRAATPGTLARVRIAGVADGALVGQVLS